VVQELQRDDPQRIGPYRLVGRLGSGGMGRVFLGRSAGGRLVAVKVIRDDLAADPEFRARFGREVAAARQVGGLFTALVIDADVESPMPWLATSYVSGPSLADAVSEHGPLPPQSVLSLAAGLAEGLNAIHAVGLVHRDLKPSNVLLADDGPRVIDFGISRAAEASVLTRTGLVVGSPGFMSPEQAEGGEVGPASDMFSLGAVIVFAATGTPPFGAGSTAALVYRVVHSSPSLDHVPPEVRPLAERCLAKDPGQRPTPADLLVDLGDADLDPAWLPTQIIQRSPQRASPGVSSADAADSGTSPAWVPTERSAPPSAPGDAPSRPSTVTSAKLSQPQALASPQPPLGIPDRLPRRRRRMIAALVASVAVLGALAVTGWLGKWPPAVFGSAAPQTVTHTVTWIPASAPLPADAAATSGQTAGTGLLSVTCPAAGSCVSVGAYTLQVGSTGLIETLSHRTWTPATATLPADASAAHPQAFLGAVTCPAVGSCIAVGGYALQDGSEWGLIETLSHGTWIPASAPLPANARAASQSQVAILDAVACQSVGSCLAIGYYTPKSSGSLGLIETLSHGTWTPAALPLPVDANGPNPYVVLDAVACPAVGNCTAVGDYERDDGSLQGLIETLSHGTWTPAALPLPAGTAANPNTNIVAVACPVPGTCVASGDYTSKHGGSLGLIETLSDGTWIPAKAPLPADAAASQTKTLPGGGGLQIGVSGVACRAPGTCVATGNYVTQDRGVQGLIETLANGIWAPITAPLPAGAEAANQIAAVAAVTCPAADSCVVTGGYIRGNGAGQVLIETATSAGST
jgi:serine/threonine protein kinase